MASPRVPDARRSAWGANLKPLAHNGVVIETDAASIARRARASWAEVVAAAEAATAFTHAQIAATDRDQNARDVVWHLHEWHGVMSQWLARAADGYAVEFPAPGYEGQPFAAPNADFHARAQSHTLTEAVAAGTSSLESLLELIAGFSETELAEARDDFWGGGTLGELTAECTYRHCDWALTVLAPAVRR